MEHQARNPSLRRSSRRPAADIRDGLRFKGFGRHHVRCSSNSQEPGFSPVGRVAALRSFRWSRWTRPELPDKKSRQGDPSPSQVASSSGDHRRPASKPWIAAIAALVLWGNAKEADREHRQRDKLCAGWQQVHFPPLVTGSERQFLRDPYL